MHNYAYILIVKYTFIWIINLSNLYNNKYFNKNNVLI